jgi:hypothetical protein
MLARTHKSIEPFDAALKNLWLYFELLQAQRAGEDAANAKHQERKAKRTPGSNISQKSADTLQPQNTNSDDASLSIAATS